ncbi:MAG: hypothetical protein HYU66_14590, partial [Armatimonadetes bacterium]|nr:hypothetical protein [Armatimonadota bacterium]
GLAFRSTKTSSTNSELVIFLTPHVLTERGRLSDEAAEMETRTKLLDEGRR